MELNVMIVDDEAHIRSGIARKVDWERLGMRVAAEASDGAEALEFLLNGKIDLVITDINMPVMDGLRLIQVAVEAGSSVKFIIVSGYSEFEYARTAMKYGISEYLLKPLKDTEMQASLEKIRDEILSKETVWLKERAEREHSKRKEESLLHWLTDKQPPITSAELEAELRLDPEASNYLIGVMKTEFRQSPEASADRSRELTLPYDIEAEFQNFLSRLGKGSIIKSLQPEHDFILVFHPDSLNERLKIIRLLDSFLAEAGSRLGVRATVGVGRTYKDANDIKLSYREALFAVKERLLYGSGKAIDFEKIPVKGDKPNFSSETRLLVRFLNDRKWDQIREHIDQLFKRSLQRKIIANHNHLYELFFEIYFAIKQFAQELGLLQEAAILESDSDITELVRRFSDVDQMTDWLYQYTEAACHPLKDGTDNSGKDIVHRVAGHIKEFCSSDMTLQLVAGKYHINPIYFSRIFKIYIGESFNNYITRIRMDEARKLMESTSLRLQEISEIVGYEDPKYFSKVFKKHFGVSPSLYAEEKKV